VLGLLASRAALQRSWGTKVKQFVQVAANQHIEIHHQDLVEIRAAQRLKLREDVLKARLVPVVEHRLVAVKVIHLPQEPNFLQSFKKWQRNILRVQQQTLSFATTCPQRPTQDQSPQEVLHPTSIKESGVGTAAWTMAVRLGWLRGFACDFGSRNLQFKGQPTMHTTGAHLSRQKLALLRKISLHRSSGKTTRIFDGHLEHLGSGWYLQSREQLRQELIAGCREGAIFQVCPGKHALKDVNSKVLGQQLTQTPLHHLPLDAAVLRR